MRAFLIALATVAGMFTWSSLALAGSSQLVADLFKYECLKANADNLAFTCGTQGNFPVFTLSREPKEIDRYRLQLLQLRILQANVGSFGVINKMIGKRRSCSPSVGKQAIGSINRGIHPYSFYCGDWQPIP